MHSTSKPHHDLAGVVIQHFASFIKKVREKEMASESFGSGRTHYEIQQRWLKEVKDPAKQTLHTQS